MKSRFIVLAALAAVGFGATGAHADILIDLQAPMTGVAAFDGKSAKIATEIAIADINAAGGVLGQKLKLQIFDDQAQGAQAVSIANQIVGDNKAAVVIADSYSEPTRAAATIFQTAKMPYISAVASHPDITKAGDYVFRGSQLGDVQGFATAAYIAKQGHGKKVDIIAVDNDFGASTAGGFKKGAAAHGLDVIREYTFGNQDRQFGAIIAGLKRDNPDVIYLTAYAFNGGPLVAQIRSSGIKTPIVASQGVGGETFLKIAGPAAEGVVIVDNVANDNPDPTFQRFFKELKKRHGDQDTYFAVIAYSAVQLAADAIRRAGSTDHQKVRDALAATKNLETVHGLLRGFTKGREIIEDMPVVVVKNGDFAYAGDIETNEQ